MQVNKIVRTGLLISSGVLGTNTACVSTTNPPPQDTSDSATPVATAICDADGDGVADPTPFIQTLEPTTYATTGITINATTCGLSTTAVLNAFQTGSAAADAWDEEHIVASTSYTEGDANNPPMDVLSLALTHVDTIGEQIPDSTTLFNDADSGAMTYVLRVYDEADALTDCGAWGDKVSTVLDGSFRPTNNSGQAISNDTEISAANCLDWGAGGEN